MRGKLKGFEENDDENEVCGEDNDVGSDEGSDVDNEALISLPPIREEFSNHSHLFTFSGSNKAGMIGFDKKHQEKVIYEMSKDSAFFKRAVERDKRTSEKVSKMLESIRALTASQKGSMEQNIQKQMKSLELRRNLRRICVVMDMDMFFAAVEIRDNPSLADKPVAVGGTGMISTSNYVARRFGVRSAMPGFIAKKLCPELVFIKPNYAKYEQVGKLIRDVVFEYDKNFKSLSLDEVYFDITQICLDRYHISYPFESNKVSEIYDEAHPKLGDIDIEKLREIADTVVQEIRKKVFERTNGLSCSAGIANNFFLAKICADQNKPNGQFSLAPYTPDIVRFLHDLPTRKVGGIGSVMEKMLLGLGCRTMGDVRNNISNLMFVFPGVQGKFLLRRSLGLSDEECLDVPPKSRLHSMFGFEPSNSSILAPENSDYSNDNDSDSSATEPIRMSRKRSLIQDHVEESWDHLKAHPSSDRKSISVERTFRTVDTMEDLFCKLGEVCEKLAQDLSEHDLSCRTITVKLKSSDFEVTSKCQSLTRFVSSSSDLFSVAKELTKKILDQKKDKRIHVRLIGVSGSNFESDLGCSIMDNYLVMSHGTNSTSNSAVVDTHISSSFAQKAALQNFDNISIELTKKSVSLDSIPSSFSTNITQSSNCPISGSNIVSSTLSSSCSPSAPISGSPSMSTPFLISSPRSSNVDTCIPNSKSNSMSHLHEKFEIACPNCHVLLQGSLVIINRHLDSCVLIESHDSSFSSSTKQKQKHRSTIDNFFSSKTNFRS